MNKHLLFSLMVLAIMSTGLVAQNFTLTPNPASGSADLDSHTSNPDDVVAYASITNNTSDTLFLKWERVINDKPESWETAVCDIYLCYPPTASTNEFMLLPNQEDGDMLVHAYPGKQPGGIPMYGAEPGEATVHILITNLNDPADTLIAVYNFTVTGDPVTSISEVELEALKVYPNPASDYFRLTETQEIEQLVIYNILGRQVKTFEANSNQRYNISNLPNGVYLVGMVDRDQDTVKTIRLQKH